MNRIICWFRTFWRTFIYPATWETGASFDGHDWQEHKDGKMDCMVCGKEYDKQIFEHD